MNASKFGYLLLAAAAFATPACFTADDSDDDDDGGEGGESGEGSGGSSSGTAGNGGTGSPASGGSSGSGGGGSGGSSGSTTVGSCHEDDLNLTAECPAGSISQYLDPDCNAYFRCTFSDICTTSGLNCSDCELAVASELTTEDVCVPEGSFESIGEACLQAAANLADMYPQCAPGQ